MTATPSSKELLTLRINVVSAAIGARAAAKVAPLGVDDRMIAVLLAVDALDRPSQQEIATHAGIDRTTVSKAIDRLEAQGLVNRHIDPRHRRRNWIELTSKARRTLSRVRRVFADCDAEVLAPLSEAERRQLARILGKLEQSAGVQNEERRPPAQSATNRAPRADNAG